MSAGTSCDRQGGRNDHNFVQEHIPYITESDNQYRSNPSYLNVHLILELAHDALLHQRLIGPGASTQSRRLSQLIAGIELAGSPSNPAKVHIRVVVHGIELLTKHGQAGLIASTTTRLGQDGLALVVAKPATEGLESVDVVGRAGGVRAAAV